MPREHYLRAGMLAAFWIPWIVCTYLALDPSPAESVMRISDVLLHGFAFTYLTVALGLAHRHGHWLVPAGWMLAYGIVLEAVQSFEPQRSAELKDVLVDMVGIALGSGVGYWLSPWVRQALAPSSA